MPTDSGRPSMMDAIAAGEPVRMTIGRNSCFSDPVQSPIDGQHYTTKHAYYDHLKRNNCHVNDYTIEKPKEVQGDFNVKAELREALNKVLG